MRLSEDYAIRARTELDIDDPSIDCLQALLLLGVAFTAAGKGKKAYMMLGMSIFRSQGSVLMEDSERYWNGGSTRAASGIRPQDPVNSCREGNAETIILDLLSHGQVYSMWIQTTFTDRRQVYSITAAIMDTQSSSTAS